MGKKTDYSRNHLRFRPVRSRWSNFSYWFWTVWKENWAVQKYGEGTLQGQCSEDEGDLEISWEQAFHTCRSVYLRLMNSSFSDFSSTEIRTLTRAGLHRYCILATYYGNSNREDKQIASTGTAIAHFARTSGFSCTQEIVEWDPASVLTES